MPCDEMRDRLSPYLEGELSESERKALEAHLGECADCAALLAVLRESRVASRRARSGPPVHLARRIQEAVAQKAAEQSRPRAAWGWTWMPAFAAAASFLAMIGLIAYLDRSAKAPVMIAAKVEQETPRPAPVPASAPPPARAMEPEKVAALAKEGEKAATPETRVRKDSLSAGRLLAGRAEDVEQKTEVSRADERLEAARPRPAERSYPAAKQEFAKIAPPSGFRAESSLPRAGSRHHPLPVRRESEGVFHRHIPWRSSFGVAGGGQSQERSWRHGSRAPSRD